MKKPPKREVSSNATLDWMRKNGLPMDRKTYLLLNDQDEDNPEEQIPEELEELE